VHTFNPLASIHTNRALGKIKDCARDKESKMGNIYYHFVNLFNRRLSILVAG